jgi:hypothetical protein
VLVGNLYMTLDTVSDFVIFLNLRYFVYLCYLVFELKSVLAVSAQKSMWPIQAMKLRIVRAELVEPAKASTYG